MVRLWYSNHLEQLVESLVEQVRAHRASSDPFDPVRIVVPNRNLATFLKFEIARRTGITANVEFEYLYGFFRDLVPEQAGLRLLDRRGMHAVLVDAFADPTFRDEPALAPVFHYIDATDDADGRQRRRFQLAQQVGRVFEEYTLSRPRMLKIWPDGPLFDDEPWRSAEAWQRALWLAVFGPNGRLAELSRAHDTRFLPLGDMVNAVAVNELDLPKVAHVFGLSYVARVFYDLFYRISSLCELNIYTLNPCMEYWEDVPAGWRVPQRDTFLRRHAEQATLAFGGEADLWDYEDDVAPLRLWGRPGRDNVRLLNILTNCDFESRFVDPMADGDTLLHRIQRDILTRHPARTTPDFAYDDDSIQVLECPTVQREVESIANAIWEFKADAEARGEELSFNDIAVIVSARQREAYQARIRSVFQATHDIPHNIVDISATSHRRYLEAVHLLLQLPFGEFARNELLKLVTHPNVLATIPAADRDTWVRWVDEVGVVFGADRQDLDGTYVDEDLFTWDQGLRRLALGGFMASNFAGDDRVFDAGNGFSYVPYELGGQEAAAAGELIGLVRSLIADARSLGEGVRPLAEWMDLAARLVTGYLAPDDDDDEYERGRVLDELRRIAELDLAGEPVPYRIAWEFVADALGRLEISRGQYLAEGVVVSSFLPMRPIPFKIVFVTGMGEKFFPRAETRSPLDLRWAKPEIGDVFSTRDQDEYMFLETLVSTRQRFVISYVSRDAQTGERLEPSPVVRELLFMIERGYTDDRGREHLVRTMPLRRWEAPLEAVEVPLEKVEVVGRFDGDDDIAPWEIDEVDQSDSGASAAPAAVADNPLDLVLPPRDALPWGARAYQPEAQAEARAAALRDALEAWRPADRSRPASWTELDRALSNHQRERVAHHLGVFQPPDLTPGVADKVEITLNQMRNFLRSPLQGAARFYLGMREEVFDDPIEVEDELLETRQRDLYVLLRDVFMKHLASDGETLRQVYDRRTRRLELEGKLPTGLFRDAERDKHLRLLNLWRSNVANLGVDVDALGAVSFGGRMALDVPTTRRRAIELDVPLEAGNVHVRLTGRTAPFDASGTSMQLVTSKLERIPAPDEARFFRGFLDLMWLVACGDERPDAWRVALVTTGRTLPDVHLREFRVPSASEARSYLTDIASDMLRGTHAYRMPMEAAFAWHIEDWLPFHERLDKFARDTRGNYASHWGPIRDPERWDSPPDHRDIFERRLMPYFAHRVDEVER